MSSVHFQLEVTTHSAVVEQGRLVIERTAESLCELAHRLDDQFESAVGLLQNRAGRVIVTGVGKSGLIGRKIAATMTSTGTPAIFLHPVDGLHGDIGVVERGDVAILISKSGRTVELAGVIDFLERMEVPMVAITGGGRESQLGRAAVVVLDCKVPAEACPLDLAPTTSSTAALVMGDALAIALQQANGFGAEDFAVLHPGGTLGARLNLRVRDIMIADDVPHLTADQPMSRAVVLLARKRGTLPIVDDNHRLIGIVTAGDLARLIEDNQEFLQIPVSQVLNPRPKTGRPEMLARDAVGVLQGHGIMALPVVDAKDKLCGIVHLHDLLRAGVV